MQFQYKVTVNSEYRTIALHCVCVTVSVCLRIVPPLVLPHPCIICLSSSGSQLGWSLSHMSLRGRQGGLIAVALWRNVLMFPLS